MNNISSPESGPAYTDRRFSSSSFKLFGAVRQTFHLRIRQYKPVALAGRRNRGVFWQALRAPEKICPPGAVYPTIPRAVHS